MKFVDEASLTRLTSTLRTREELVDLASALDTLRTGDLAFADEAIADAFDALTGSELSDDAYDVLTDVSADLERALAARILSEAAAAGVPTLDEVAETSAKQDPDELVEPEAAATLEVAFMLQTAKVAIADLDGSGDDRDRIVALLNLGFADTLAKVPFEDCVRDLDELDRAAAVMTAGTHLADAINAATGMTLAAAAGQGDPVTMRRLAELVDPPAADLLAYFPDVVEEFAAELTAQLDYFLEQLG